MDFLLEFGIKLLAHGVDCRCCDLQQQKLINTNIDVPVNGEQDKHVDVVFKKVKIEDSPTLAAIGDSERSLEPKLLTVQTAIPSSVGHDTPDTATDKLFYGSNSFGSRQIVIAAGYFIEIDLQNAVIWNLYLMRTRGEHMRVAQIGLDGQASLPKHKSIVKKNGNVHIYHGVFDVLPDSDGDFDAEFYFLSKM